MKIFVVFLIVFFGVGFVYVNAESRNCVQGTLCVFPNEFLKYKIVTDGSPDSVLTVTFGNQMYDNPRMLEVRETTEPSNPNQENWDTYLLNAEDGTFTQSYPYGEWLEYDYVYPYNYVADYSWVKETFTGSPSKIEEPGSIFYNGQKRDAVFVEKDNHKLVIDSKTGIMLSGLYWFSYSGGSFSMNYILIDTNITELKKTETKQIKKTECSGTKLCIKDKVKRVVDGDTIYIKDYKIRLSLTNTPERTEKGFKEALLFTKKMCPVGSSITIDQDDKQPFDRYNRVLGKVTCGDKVINAELLYNNKATIMKQYCSKSEFAKDDWAKKFGCEQKQTNPVKIDEKSSLTQLSEKWKTISDFGHDVKKVVPTTVSGFNAVYNLGVLGSLAPDDPDVNRQWEYLILSIRYMNSKQIDDWITLMKDRAIKENLDSVSMNYFNEQIKKVEKQKELKRDREPIKSRPDLQSYSIFQYKEKINEYKNELESANISKNHFYIRDKMIQYLKMIDSSIDSYVLGEGNALSWQQAENLEDQADDLEYEIDGKFIAENDVLNNSS